MPFFKKLFNGEQTVARTYWVGFVLFHLFANMAFTGLRFVLLDAYIMFSKISVELFSTALMLLCIIYLACVARGMYRSMYNNRQPSFISWIGIGLVGWGIATYIYSISIIFAVGLPDPDSLIRKKIATSYGLTPKDLSHGMVLSNVEFSAGIYRYSIKVPSPDYMPDYENFMVKGVGREWCQKFENYFRSSVTRVEFEYTYESDNHILFINKNECIDFIDKK